MPSSNVVKAYIKGIDQAPRKVSLVASLVRRRSVEDALVILTHTPKRAAKPVAKAIESAKANAVNNHGLDPSSLIISTLSVTIGGRLKRYKPAGRGRALPFQKKSSNVFIELTGEPKQKKEPAKKASTAVTKKEAK